jgi:hypothetical protein
LLTILVYHLIKAFSINKRQPDRHERRADKHLGIRHMSRILWIDARLGALNAQDIERAKAAETMASADDGRERDLYELPSNTVEASSNVHHPGGWAAARRLALAIFSKRSQHRPQHSLTPIAPTLLARQGGVST